MTLFPVKKDTLKRSSRRERKNRKREKARSAYMRSLMRKPKYLREVLRILPILLIIMLLADYAFTKLAAAYYIGETDQEIEHYEEKIDYMLARETNPYDTIDFNQAFQPTAGAADAGRERVYRAMAELSYRLSSAIFTYPSENPSFFERLWDTYYFRIATQSRYYHYDIPFWDFAYSALYNTEGQRLADESAGIYLIVTRESDGDMQDTNIYMLDLERVEEKYPGMFEELRGRLNPALNGGRKDIRLRFNGLYIKENKNMLPTEITVLDGDTPTAVYDLSDCDFSGYSMLTLEEWSCPADENSFVCAAPGGVTLRFVGPVLLGEHISRDYHEELFERLDRNDVAENVKRAAKEQMAIYRLNRTAYQVSGYVCKPTRNETVVSVVALDYDFFRDWKEILAWAYGLNLAAALLLTLFMAWLRFQKRRLSYEVDAYRRRTTDAMAHDLKSPLMAISGYAENIASRTEPSKTQQYADSILAVVKDMDRMIGNILDLSRLESSRDTLKPEEISIRKLVEEQSEKYKKELEEKGLEITVTGEALLSADEEQMRHLVDNLISNAVRYARRESEIAVGLSGDVLSVRNVFDYELTADPKTLLEPFVKGDAARSITHGNGLGLSIVNQIAKAHGFSVEIRSKEQVFEVRVNMAE